MSRFTRRSRFTGAAAASLFVLAAAAAPLLAQAPPVSPPDPDEARRDPPPVAVAIQADHQVRAVRIDWRLGTTAATQAPAPRPRPRYVDDSTVNGLVAGTALGTMGGLLAGMGAVDRCGGHLCNRPPLHTYLLYGGVGAGTGAFTGWLIDKLHKAPAAMPDAVAVSAAGEAHAVHVQWRF
jgi:hypothetical protein